MTVAQLRVLAEETVSQRGLRPTVGFDAKDTARDARTK